jgi:hypothetical protein
MGLRDLSCGFFCGGSSGCGFASSTRRAVAPISGKWIRLSRVETFALSMAAMVALSGPVAFVWLLLRG